MLVIIVAGPALSAFGCAKEAEFFGVTGVAGVGVGGCSASVLGVGGALAVEPFPFAAF